MLFKLTNIVLLWATVSAAPAEIGSPLAHQFIILTPPAQQIQYEPLIKIQQPLFQQITPLGRIENAQKQQLILLYPNGQLTQYPNSQFTQYPLISLRQDGGGGDWWSSVQNFFQGIGANFGQNPEAATEKPETPAEGQGEKKILSEKISETIPVAAAAAAAVPASTVPLANKRYFILAEQPQFFGKIEAFRSPILSLQPLQAVKARSVDAPIQSLDQIEPIVQAAPQDAIQYAAPLPPIVPMSAGEALHLRSTLSEPLQPLQIDGLLIDEEPKPESDPQQVGRFFVETIPQSKNKITENFEEKKEEPATPYESDEPSVAQAKPTGIAVSGKGGVSSSAPVGTAIAGDGGLALASPSATAVSGDFEDDEEKLKPKF